MLVLFLHAHIFHSSLSPCTPQFPFCHPAWFATWFVPAALSCSSFFLFSAVFPPLSVRSDPRRVRHGSVHKSLPRVSCWGGPWGLFSDISKIKERIGGKKVQRSFRWWLPFSFHLKFVLWKVGNWHLWVWPSVLVWNSHHLSVQRYESTSVFNKLLSCIFYIPIVVSVRIKNTICLLVNLDLVHREKGVNSCMMTLVQLKKSSASSMDSDIMLQSFHMMAVFITVAKEIFHLSSIFLVLMFFSFLFSSL